MSTIKKNKSGKCKPSPPGSLKKECDNWNPSFKYDRI